MYGWPSCTSNILELSFFKMQIFQILGDTREEEENEAVSVLTRCVEEEWEEGKFTDDGI